MSASDPTAGLRWGVYGVLIALACGNMLGRIAAVDSVDVAALQEHRIQRELENKRRAFAALGLKGDELSGAIDAEEVRLRELLALERPFLSANDRSRWCTVRALVEPEMRVPGRPFAIDRVIAQPRWDTIDMVKRHGHFYSSKPPLLPAAVAALYWPLYHWAGLSLADEPYAVGRLLLVLVNVVPLALALLLVCAMVERFGRTDWGRVLVVAAACLGTFLTTFAVVLNNHLPAAVCTAVVLWATVRIWFDPPAGRGLFALAGLSAALLATVELPALSLTALWGAALLWRFPRQTLLGFVPAAAAVAVVFFAVNQLAYQSLRPPYAHRKPGDNWYDFTYQRGGKTYESYWNNPVGIDRGEPSRAIYAVNVLVGHHGVFSLTPIWVLSIGGLWAWLRCKADRRRELAALIAAPSLVCLAFYILQSEGNRNYGGMTSGLRWMFWFAPMWLVAMTPAADWAAARRWRQAVALILLAASVLSASYPTWNPWTHPWLYNLAFYLGWM